MWAALLQAGPYAPFLLLLVWLLVAYYRGRIISLAELNRRVAEMGQQYDRAVVTEQRIAAYHEKRAEQEAARADTVTAALVKLTAELPEALRQLRGAA